ncbi:MAG: tetratricopeptide repeat protein [Candidatus Melainabacteria bacterium]|nr:tetratricopeptide repeat protein [Candidatus Melainabacteria bacterium]
MSFTTRKIVPLLLIAVALTSCGEVGKPDFGKLTGGGGGNQKFEDVVAQARAAKDAGNTAEAEKLYNQAIEICTKKFGENAAQTGTCVGYLAELYMAKQDWKLAYTNYKRWQAIMQEVDPGGEQLKIIQQDLRKIKEKLIQYNLVPEEVLKKRAERKAEDDKKKSDASKDK